MSPVVVEGCAGYTPASKSEGSWAPTKSSSSTSCRVAPSAGFGNAATVSTATSHRHDSPCTMHSEAAPAHSLVTTGNPLDHRTAKVLPESTESDGSTVAVLTVSVGLCLWRYCGAESKGPQ